nr:unnamed protein product [Digitaria exilis]
MLLFSFGPKSTAQPKAPLIRKLECFLLFEPSSSPTCSVRIAPPAAARCGAALTLVVVAVSV